MHEPTCAFTGHRPGKLPWGYDETDPRCRELKQRLYDTAEAVASAGFRRFLCGMAEGCDLYFAESLLLLRQVHEDVSLGAAIPFRGQAERWSAEQRTRYHRILDACDSVFLQQEHYAPGCMMARNRYMVNHSSLLLACYNGEAGGTRNTILYAKEKGLEILTIPIE